jgi:hypothetical protein
VLGRVLERDESDEGVAIKRSVGLGELEILGVSLGVEERLSAGNDTVSTRCHVVVGSVVGLLERLVDVLELALRIEVGRAALEDSLGSTLDEEGERTVGVRLLDDDERGWERIGVSSESRSEQRWDSLLVSELKGTV